MVKKSKVISEPENGFVSDDSDEELQELFAQGILKPGLNIPVDAVQEKKTFINNIVGLKRKLQEIQTTYPWIERLDLVSGYAPMAPEMALQIEEEKERDELISGEISTTKQQLDEFKREALFHRQAQAAALEGLKRLKSLGIQTKRPDDYFAEMAKSDEHMQKVRTMLVKKHAQKERTEKVRKIREQRKLSKKIQAENRLKKQNEKKEMMDEVKKFRKGVRKDLDFLDDKKRSFKSNKTQNSRSQMKRKYKNKKFGFGGKKRDLKRNTKESSANFDENRQRGPKNKGQNKRPGKTRRQNMKSKKRN